MNRDTHLDEHLNDNPYFAGLAPVFFGIEPHHQWENIRWRMFGYYNKVRTELLVLEK